MLKPFGALSLSSGILSAVVASGGDGTGASFSAAGLLSGRPISGEPGGSAGLSSASTAVASKASVAASNGPRVTRYFMMSSQTGSPVPAGFLGFSFRYFHPGVQSGRI